MTKHAQLADTRMYGRRTRGLFKRQPAAETPSAARQLFAEALFCSASEAVQHLFCTAEKPSGRPALCCLHGAALGSNSGGLRMEAAAERPGRPGPEGPRPTLGRGEDTPGAELNPCLPRHAGKARFRCVQRGSRRVSLARWRRQDRRAQVRLRDARIGEPSALHMRLVVLLCIWEVIGTCRWQSL